MRRYLNEIRIVGLYDFISLYNKSDMLCVIFTCGVSDIVSRLYFVKCMNIVRIYEQLYINTKVIPSN